MRVKIFIAAAFALFSVASASQIKASGLQSVCGNSVIFVGRGFNRDMKPLDSVGFSRWRACFLVLTQTLQPRQKLLSLQGASAPEGKPEPLLWKAVTNAFLRVNDQGIKEWSVFQIEKKDPRYLIQVADRFLLVDAQRKQVFELAPARIQRSGADVLWDPAHRPSRPLATSAWIARDVGLAYRVKMRLDAEDRTLDLQLPYAE